MLILVFRIKKLGIIYYLGSDYLTAWMHKPTCASVVCILHNRWLQSWNFGYRNKQQILSKQRTTNVLIKQCRCAGWSALLLFAYVFSITNSLLSQFYIDKSYLSVRSDYIPCPQYRKVKYDILFKYVTKTSVFKYIDNFTSKNWKFSDKKTLIFFIFLFKNIENFTTKK